MLYEQLANAERLIDAERLVDAERLPDVRASEVLEVLAAPRRWPRAATDPATDLRILTIWARTSAGRPLLVAVRPLDEQNWQIIGARSLSSVEAAQFQQWEAGHE